MVIILSSLVYSDDSMTIENIFELHGQLYSMEQFQGIMRTYKYVTDIIDNLDDYRVFIEDEKNDNGEELILVSYIKKDIFFPRMTPYRTERASTDIITYEIRKTTGEIIKFYYDIK